MPSSHFLNIHFNVNHPSTPRSSKWSLSLSSRYQNPVRTSPVCRPATCPAHVIILDLTNRMTFGEQHRSLSFCRSPSQALPSPSAPHSRTPTACVPSLSDRPSFTPIQKNRHNYGSAYFDLRIVRQQLWEQRAVLPTGNWTEGTVNTAQRGQLCAVLPNGNWTEGTVNTTQRDSCVQCCQLDRGNSKQHNTTHSFLAYKRDWTE